MTKVSIALSRRLKVMLLAQVSWLILVCALGIWWERLVLVQARTIADLQTKLGQLPSEVKESWSRTHSMMYWESATFLVLLAASTALLFWLYWQEERRARGLQAFFASVTHELRTPLTSIRLQAESIADDLKGGTTQTLVKRLLEDTHRLEGQIDRTLELARVEGGGGVLCEPLRLLPLIENWSKNWAERNPGLRIDFQIVDSLIRADARAVQMILRNLFENSLKHGSSGGKTPVHAKMSTEIIGDFVWVKYFDEGTGFQGDSRRLGQLFYRGFRSQGTGIGLYLISALMKKMGGEAQFVTSPKFEVSLRFHRESSDG